MINTQMLDWFFRPRIFLASGEKFQDEYLEKASPEWRKIYLYYLKKQKEGVTSHSLLCDALKENNNKKIKKKERKEDKEK